MRSMNMNKWMLLLLLASSFAFTLEVDLGTENQKTAGKKIYDKKCSQCHGNTGAGDGYATEYFNPKPRDFTSGAYKYQSTPSGDLPSHNDLKEVIRRGMPYTGMPANPELSEEELDDVVYYIKSFLEDFADADNIVDPISLPEPPPLTDVSIKKGREIFEKMECADCHGDLGRGYGKSASTLEDDWGSPIKPADLTKRWTFRTGSSRADLYRIIMNGIGGTPMPSFLDLAEEGERWPLVDYVYSLSQDKPNYGTVVSAKFRSGEIDIQDTSLFEQAEKTKFSIFGQMIESNRNFFSSVSDVDVKAIYNEKEIALQIKWSDILPNEQGENTLVKNVIANDDSTITDAFAVQFPVKITGTEKKPYLLFGDKKRPMRILYRDLGKEEGKVWVGKGSDKLSETEEGFSSFALWKDGQWTLTVIQSLESEWGKQITPEQFIPVLFSVWDGFYKETGNKMGMSSWYSLYLEPMQEKSAFVPAIKYFFIVFILEVLFVLFVRFKVKSKP